MPGGGRHPSRRTGRSTTTPGGNSVDNYKPLLDYNVKSLVARNNVSAGTSVAAGTTLKANCFKTGVDSSLGNGIDANRFILPVVDISSSYMWHSNPKLGEMFFEASGNNLWIGDLSGVRGDNNGGDYVKWGRVDLDLGYNHA